MRTMRILTQLLSESGLPSLILSPRDTKVICLQRFVRNFGYGATSIHLTFFLGNLGNNEERLGLFMSLTLWGDVIISLVLTAWGDSLGRKNILLIGSALMFASGVIFATCRSYWTLLLAAIVGVISPSGNEIGPFRAIEESTLAQLASSEHRNDVFSWYTLFGILGAAAGTFSSGHLVENLIEKRHRSAVEAYRVIFMIYAGMGATKFILSLFLTNACEASPGNSKKHEPDPSSQRTRAIGAADGSEDADDPARPLLPPPDNADTQTPRNNPSLRAYLPHITSTRTLLKLSALFALDAFASGLVPTTWLSFYFNARFGLFHGALGNLFSATACVAALSSLLSAVMSRRVGLIATMVLTHLPSSLFLGLIPSARVKALAVAFLMLRSCTAQVDTAPKQAFVAMAVRDGERTAVMGAVNVVKTLAQGFGPWATGALAGTGRFWCVFVGAAGLKVAYDLGVLVAFWGWRGMEGESGEDEVGVARGEDA